MMWRVALAFGIAVHIFLWIDRVLTRRKLRRLLTERECRRWYPTMQAVRRNTRGRWDA